MENLHPKVKLRGALKAHTPIQILWRHIKDLKWVYGFGWFSVLLTTLAEVGVPQIVKRAVDILGDSSLTSVDVKEEKFIYFLYILVGLFFLQFLGRIGWRIWIAQQAHHVGAKMKSILWDRSRFLSRKKLDQEYRPGDLMNIATGDVNIGRFIYSFTLVMTSDMIFLMVLTLVSMFLISPKLTWWTLGTLSLLPFLLHRLAKIQGRLHDKAQTSLSDLSDLSAQTVSTIRLQRLTQTSEFWKSKLFESARNYMFQRRDVIYTDLKFIPLTGLTPIVSYSILLIIGIRDVQLGLLSVGSFVAMQSYIFLLQVPLTELGSIVAEWQRALTSLRRMQNVFNEEEAPQLRNGGHSNKIETSTVFEVNHLGYCLPDSNIELFDDLSFKIKDGERLGILGPVGAGKSTLLNLIGGLERDFSGEILLWGQPIQNYSHQFLRANISMVPQRPFLFADTIRNNICMDQPLSDSDIWRLLELADVAQDVRGFENMLDTKIGEWGVTLSGGQKQRLTLARALARKPKILLLDDCLSAVDTVTEEKILKSIDQKLKETTLVWVAHRKSTLKYCDHIIELNRHRAHNTSQSSSKDVES